MTVNTTFEFATATLMMQCPYDQNILDDWFACFIEEHTNLKPRMSEFNMIAPYDAGTIQLYCDVAYVGPWHDGLFQDALATLLKLADGAHGGGVFHVQHRPITFEELDAPDRAPLMD